MVPFGYTVRLCPKEGQRVNGFDVKYDSGVLMQPGGGHTGTDDSGTVVNGSPAQRVLETADDERHISGAIACGGVGIKRGQDSRSEFVQYETYDGCLFVKRGRSVQYHLHLINICRDEYAKTIKHIEDHRIGVNTIEGGTLVVGKSFDFKIGNAIKDLEYFIDGMFNSAQPFRLWGLKSKV